MKIVKIQYDEPFSHSLIREIETKIQIHLSDKTLIQYYYTEDGSRKVLVDGFIDDVLTAFVDGICSALKYG